MDDHQNLEYDVSSKSRVWFFIKIQSMDEHQNLEYGSSLKLNFWSYPDLGMDHHQNLEYDFIF